MGRRRSCDGGLTMICGDGTMIFCAGMACGCWTGAAAGVAAGGVAIGVGRGRTGPLAAVHGPYVPPAARMGAASAIDMVAVIFTPGTHISISGMETGLGSDDGAELVGPADGDAGAAAWGAVLSALAAGPVLPMVVVLAWSGLG